MIGMEWEKGKGENVTYEKKKEKKRGGFLLRKTIS